MGGAVGPRQHGLLAALLGGLAERRVGQRFLGALSAAVILAACAPTASIARSGSRLMTRAQECQRTHPEIERWEVDRFGHVTAYYRMAASATASTDPFFSCIRR